MYYNEYIKRNKGNENMLSSSDLKKFFNEDLSFEQADKRIYLIPLKEFMKSEEFSELPNKWAMLLSRSKLPIQKRIPSKWQNLI